jgi:hypothetical protein
MARADIDTFAGGRSRSGGEDHVASGEGSLVAREEHASIAAFARTICEHALGAPTCFSPLRRTRSRTKCHADESFRAGGAPSALPKLRCADQCSTAELRPMSRMWARHSRHF